MTLIETLTALASRNIELRLTDGKLKVVAAKGAVNKQDMAFLKEHKPRILDCFEYLAVSSNRQFELLSANQQQLWLVDKIEGNSVHYNMPTAFALHGKVDPELLHRALQHVVERHGILRTVYREFEGQPVQVVVQQAKVPFEQVSLVGKSDIPKVLAERLTTHEQYQFNLAEDVMVRALWLEQAPDESVLAINIHHIAADGWSMGVLFQELAAGYRALADGQQVQLPELPIQYLDYANWQKQQLSGESREKLNRYWHDKLSGMPQLHNLSLDRPRPAKAPIEADTVEVFLDKATTEQLHRLARDNDVSMFMLLNAAFSVLLYRHSGQSDVVFGTTSANREQSQVASLIGYFVNTLVIRNNFNGDISFAELLQRCRTTLLDAYEHQQMPFEALVEQLQPQRDLRYNPLFQIMLSLENLSFSEQSMQGLSMSVISPTKTQAKFDLSVSTVESAQGLQFSWDYATALFNRSRIEQMAEHLNNLLRGAIAGVNVPVADMPMLGEAEIRQQLIDFNPAWQMLNGPERLGIPAQAFATLPELFARQVKANIDASHKALEAESQSYSYAALDARTNRLANYLIDKGVQPGDRVGIYLPRGGDIVICVLAIYKAGGAYVPLDPTYPQDRLQYMSDDSGLKLLLCCEKLMTQAAIDLAAPGEVVLLQSESVQQALAAQSELAPEVAVNPDSLAYIMYTSGSTGQPKGVMINHSQVTAYHSAIHQLYHIDRAPLKPYRLYACSAFSFDIFVEEMVLTVFSGNTLVMGAEGLQLDATALCEALQQGDIDILSLPTAYWHYLAETLDSFTEGVLAKLTTLIVGGEAMSQSHLHRWQQAIGEDNVQVFNTYGPTEATVVATGVNVSKHHDEVISIGNGHGQVITLVLSEQMNLVPTGAIGELCLSGPVVGAGYWNRPEQSAKAFTAVNLPGVEQPLRIYRTGDLVRWQANGELSFVGRVDDQVKVRGFRVELSEIQNALEQLPGVQNAVVSVRADEHRILQIYAWVVGKDLDCDRLSVLLKDSLPEYMVPKAIGLLSKLPMTPNGKVDVESLELPQSSTPEKDYRPPQGQSEQQLAAIWAQLLGSPIEQIGRMDSFFALGGHSLLATRLVSAIVKQFAVKVSIRDVFEHPTLGALAGFIDHVGQPALDAIEKAPKGCVLPLSNSQKTLWFIHQLNGQSVQYNMPIALELKGELDLDALQQALDLIVERHQVLRTTYALDEAGEGIQLVQSARSLAIEVQSVDDSEALNERVSVLASEPIDINQHWPIRVRRLVLDEQHQVLLIVMHHIASDGWSMGVFASEFMALYRAVKYGQTPQLPQLPIQYGDFAYWQKQRFADHKRHPQLDYWAEQLAGIATLHQLPLDHPRPASPDNRGQIHRQTLDNALSGQLKNLAKEQGVTLFILLHSMFSLLIGRWSGQNDVVVGSTIAGRERAELEPLIGYFINVLPLRSHIDEGVTLAQHLAAARKTVLDAYAHQDVSFDEVVEHLNPQRSLSHQPVVQLMFSLQNTEEVMFELPELEVNGLDNGFNAIKYDLSVSASEQPDGSIEVIWNSAAALFDPASIKHMADSYQVLLAQLNGAVDKPLSTLSLLTNEDAEKLNRWQGERHCGQLLVEQPVDGILAGFAHAVAQKPEELALCCREQSLTFAELDGRINQLCHRLMEFDLVVGDFVSVCLHRSMASVVSFMACYRLGLPCVFVDPNYPKARIDYMLADHQAKVVICDGELAERLAIDGQKALRVDDPTLLGRSTEAVSPSRDVLADDLLCMIYTSGSTGQPKGVLIERQNLNTYFHGFALQRQAFGEPQCWLACATFSFDASMIAYVCLGYGMKVVVADDEQAKDPRALVSLLEQHQINTCKAPVSLIEQILDIIEEDERFAVNFHAGGEAMAQPLWQRLSDYSIRRGTEALNCYGPTECAINTNFARIKDNPVSTIGPMMPNYLGYVLDSHGNRQPVGAVGMLHVGGPSVARGYHNDPERSDKVFSVNSFDQVEHPRLYCTGDLVRMSQDGQLRYIARADKQVKLRGFRVELGEITARIGEVAGVENVVLDVRGEGLLQRLVAYLVSSSEQSGLVTEIKRHLRETLPDFMIPSAFMHLDSLPLNNNGKVDLTALPNPDFTGSDVFEPVQTELEQQLVDIWQQLLKIDGKIGRQADFFNVGGHSLLATRLVNAISEQMEVLLELRTVFECAKLCDMAQAIEHAQVMRDNSLLLQAQQDDDEDMMDMEW